MIDPRIGGGQHCQLLARQLLGELGPIQTGQLFETARSLQDHFVPAAERGSSAGLLFGQIQSGKTYRMLASIALAADNGHRLFIILTSDNRWLYEQTLGRMRRALRGLRTIGLREWDPADEQPDRLLSLLRRAGLVLVSTKNIAVLRKLANLLDTVGPDNTIPTVVYDDEADQASLNTLTNVDTNEQSAINEAIDSLRARFPSVTYIQVTATPQALFLQRVEGNYRPSFFVLFEPGDNFVGSDTYFGPNENGRYLRSIPNGEIELILSADFRGGIDIPDGLRAAICTFLTGAATKTVLGEGGVSGFTMLAHISQRQTDHISLQTYIQQFVDAATEILVDSNAHDPNFQRLVSWLRESHNDLARTHLHLPSFEEVLGEIRATIPSAQVQVLIASASSAMPSFDSAFNILVGGNRLGRGVTIPRLIVTYYGRQVRAPQIDTIMQHSRMYGYRGADLDVTRCFLTDELRALFAEIHESNSRLLNLTRTVPISEITPILLSRSTSTPLRATRASVIDLDAVTYYLAGERYFPLAPVRNAVEALDRLLEPFVDLPSAQPTTIDFLLEVLGMTRSDSAALNGSWDDVAVRACLANLRQPCGNRGAIVVRTNRRITRPFRAMLSPNDLGIFAPDVPTLTMYRFVGEVSEGWDGSPFWVPNVRFPDGPRHYIFTAA